MAQDHSLQFREPADASHSHISAHPHVSSSLHPSSNTDDSAVQSAGTVDPSHNSASTVSPPPSMERQSSVSKMAHVAKTLIKSPVEEKEHLKLEKTLSKEAKKGEVDVGVMEV